MKTPSTHTWLEQPIASANTKQQKIAEQHQQQLTKPLGSLGQLETLAIRLASLQNRQKPSVDKPHIVIFAGDHGIAEEGVSAFPQVVTGEMIRNFSRGGAAISVLARDTNTPLQIINLGTANEIEALPSVQHLQITAGTKNFLKTAAMSENQLKQALDAGKTVVDQAFQHDCNLFIAGEMGIANTTSATAIAASLLDLKPATITGPGTGLDQKGIQHKAEVIERSIKFHKINGQSSTYEVLQKVGGLEIAALCGAYLRCGQLGIPILIDGYICSVAALAANKIQPLLKTWFIFSHQSAEPGHQRLLTELDAKPLLKLDMRLGEASGAAIALPLLKAACSLHNNMATFAQAHVSESDKD